MESEIANLAPSLRDMHVSARAPDGLTALHLAVLKNDQRKVRKLLGSREHAVDERTFSGATPVMLACLFGRTTIFWFLLSRSASLSKQDYRGFTVSAYVQQGKLFPEAKDLVDRYQSFTDTEANRLGRKRIWKGLRDIGHGAMYPSAQRVGAGAITSATGSASSSAPPRILFLRKGGVFEIIESGRRLAMVEIDHPLGRKTCGGIRGDGEDQFRAIAMSGWRGEVVKSMEKCNLLENDEYFKLTRQIGALFGHHFDNMWLDCKYAATDPLEKQGAFSGCHAEKQLAVFVLRDTLSKTLGSNDVTMEAVARLKEILEGDGNVFQIKFTIELQHEPCACCLRFLKMLGDKSGLRFDWVFREWFMEGKRPKLKVVDGKIVRANPTDPDAFEDEIGELENDTGEGKMVARPRPARSESQKEGEGEREPQQLTVPQKAGSVASESEFLGIALKHQQVKLLDLAQKRRERRRRCRLAAALKASAVSSSSPVRSSPPVPSSPSIPSSSTVGISSGPHAAANSSSPAGARTRTVPFPNVNQWVSTYGSEK